MHDAMQSRQHNMPHNSSDKNPQYILKHLSAMSKKTVP